MPFCASCGTQVEGKFCPKCGAAIAAGGGAPPPASGPYVAPVSAPMADNVASALCYALGFITGIIFLVLEPYSKNRVIRYHAFQSIFLSVAVIAIDIVLGIILPVSLFSWGLYLMIWSVFRLACLILWLFTIIWAYQGKTLVLPVIGPLAQKQAQS
jgi:uncharacterized membrane protein